jgi:cytochrome oxidase Cu insertion factor (SCO1/SenC/PrrC family)
MSPDKYDKFWEIEKIADRLAIKKTLEILKENDKDFNVKLISVYNTETKKDYIKKYLKDLNTEINKKGFKTIEEINNYLIQKNKEHVRM